MVNKYYQKNKEKLRKEAQGRYQNLSEQEKEKEKRQKKAQGRYKNISEEEKEKRVSIIVIEIRIFLKKRNKRKLNI